MSEEVGTALEPRGCVPQSGEEGTTQHRRVYISLPFPFGKCHCDPALQRESEGSG